MRKHSSFFLYCNKYIDQYNKKCQKIIQGTPYEFFYPLDKSSDLWCGRW